jgi:inorganic pyrophosphatase
MSTSDEILTVDILVEIPKGSRNKYEYDPEKKMIRFDRTLFSAVHYPSDYGFILDTLGGDGDPLDALVLVWESTFPGCLIEAKPIGMFKMRDEKGEDEKILCVPVADPHWSQIESLEQVPAHLLTEISYFFATYKDLEEKKVGIDGWAGRETAVQVIRDARQRLIDSQKAS